MLVFLGQALVSALFGVVLTDALGRERNEPQQKVLPDNSVGGNQRSSDMPSYDLVGDDMDELIGAIGADVLFGDDSDLLNSLAVSGDGTSEIVGARKAKASAMLKKIMMKNAGGVIKNQLDKRRRYPLGFVPTDIPAATSASIPSAPQNLYRAERLVIPSDIAFDLGVVDIKVGNQSQLAQSVEVPAAIFTEVAIDTDVTFDTAEIGNQVSVQARSKIATGGADVEFSAALIGTIAK
jgi:hypothetical protein